MKEFVDGDAKWGSKEHALVGRIEIPLDEEGLEEVKKLLESKKGILKARKE